MLAVAVTSAEVGGMTSWGGACGGGGGCGGFDVDRHDRELHSTSIPCDDGAVRHATSGLAARGMAALQGDRGQSTCRCAPEQNDLDAMTSDDEDARSTVGDCSCTCPPQPASAPDDDDDDVDEDSAAATGASRHISAAKLNVVERSFSSPGAAAVCRSHMCLRSNTSR